MKPVAKARRLRRETTRAEARLWSRLRNGKTGYKFRRQMPIGRFIADFACVSAKLVIELDGDQHALTIERDAERTAVLETAGYLVIRFWNIDIMNNLDGVLDDIAATLAARSSETD
jgi:very-short-patch-repair endonuclease